MYIHVVGRHSLVSYPHILTALAARQAVGWWWAAILTARLHRHPASESSPLM